MGHYLTVHVVDENDEPVEGAKVEVTIKGNLKGGMVSRTSKRETAGGSTP